MRPPAFRKIGCPKPDLDISDLGCWAPQTSCLPSDKEGVPMGKLRNLYRIVRARSWWHCGEIGYFTNAILYKFLKVLLVTQRPLANTGPIAMDHREEGAIS